MILPEDIFDETTDAGVDQPALPGHLSTELQGAVSFDHPGDQRIRAEHIGQDCGHGGQSGWHETCCGTLQKIACAPTRHQSHDFTERAGIDAVERCG